MSNILDGYFGLIRKLIPDQQKKVYSVGLDIGPAECKLVQLAKHADKIELVNWAIEPVIDGRLADTIQKIITSLDAVSKSVYTAISGKGTLIRFIEMPVMSIEDLRNSFALEADKYFPFAQEDIYTDCFILDPNPKGKMMNVMAASAKKELIDQRVKLLSELGYHVDFIGLNPIAQINIINMLDITEDDVSKDKAIAILDMGESVSNLTIVINKMPWFIRDIFIGGQDFTKRISNALGVALKEAEEIKKNPGAKKQAVSNACELATMNIIRELRLSFDYFSTEKDIPIDKLFLTGGGSMLQGVAETLEKNLGIEISCWNPLSSLSLPEDMPQEDINKKFLKLGVAIGLALYEYD
ncbi:MAG: pilus assembly protein PilM [Candidatus Omnitrophica bacterium]|nr:pilus assembly protein PilM [Candidatus Omnitrophota bacterium]